MDMMNELDEDGNGNVDFKEFLHIFSANETLNEEVTKDLFMEFDKKGTN